jgi:hypothetical protein
MYTDERIHGYCRNDGIQNSNGIRKLVKLVPIPNSSQIVLDAYDDYMQNQLNEEIKYNSINLSASYIDSIFESIKLVNRYWRRIFTIDNYT